jgi:DNA-binding MarR family transcriptional regulator
LLQAVGHTLGRERSSRGAMYNATIAEVLSLNLTDLRCFEMIARSTERPITAKRLAEFTGLTTAAITGVVDRLEAGGFVRRTPHPSDRRQINLEPIETAAQRVVELYQPLQRRMNAFVKQYTDEELALIADYLERATDVIVEATRQLKDEAQGS